MPFAVRSAWAAWMSSTTRWSPFVVPGSACGMPLPIAIAHAEPGGDSCTTRKPVSLPCSLSRTNPARS